MHRERPRKSDTDRSHLFFSLAHLFPDLAFPGRGRSKTHPTRKPTPKEVGVFRTSRLAGRLRWLLRRRAAADGLVPLYGLRKALREKRERFRDVFSMPAAPPGPGCNWVSVGPRNINGRVKCLAIDPTTGDTLYAGTANGGVWRTDDGGQSWMPKMHDEDSLAIGAIAIDPTNPATIYVGTGEPVYLLSGNTPMPPGSSNHAWFYEGVGVYKSLNRADTWTLTGAIANDFIYRIAVDPGNSSIVLCAGYSATAGQGGLCRSTDGGQTWGTVANGVFTDVLFDPNNAGRAYCGLYNGGVLKSNDSGQTWTPRNSGLPSTGTIGRVSLTLAQASSNVLYAKIENNATGRLLGVYRTASAAEAPGGWVGVADPGVDRVVNAAAVEEPSDFLWWCSSIAADPTDVTGNTVYAAGVDVARSGDGGTTWTLLTKAYPGSSASAPLPTHSDQHDLAFDPTNSNKLYIANDGGVFAGTYTSGMPPVEWRKVSTGLVCTQFYDVSSSAISRSMFGGGAQDNGSMVSTGGRSWRHALGGDGGYVAFHPTDPYTFYVQYQRANILRTTDGGTMLTPANGGITGGDNGIFPATVLAIDASSPSVVFNGTDRVFRTTTGGVGVNAWSPASNVIGSVTEIAVAPSSSAVVYAGTLTGALYRATDGGATSTSFKSIFGPPTPKPAAWPDRWLSGIAIHPANANRIYITFLGFNTGGAGASDHVWRAVFASSTWSFALISTGLLNVPVGGIVFDPVTSYLYLATDVGVFRSVNDGASWQPFENGLPNTSVVDLALEPDRRILRAATHGRGMYQISLSGSCPAVDIYLRDNIIDTGDVPSPSGEPNPIRPGAVVRHWQSADIKVDAPPYAPVDALTDGVEFDNPAHRVMGAPLGYPIERYSSIPDENPVRGQTNRVYVQVHNRGSSKADVVTVKVLYADAGAGLPALPGDFWAAFPGDGFTQTHWKPIGTATINDLRTETPRVLLWDWVPSSTTSDHVCLLAMIHSPQDPLLPQTEVNVDVLTPGNKRVTHKNVHPVDPPVPGGAAGSTRWLSLDFNNASREPKFFTFRIENITDRRGGVRMILPGVALQRPLNDSLDGLRAIRIRSNGFRSLMKAAERTGGISPYVVKVAKGFHDTQILEVQPGRSSAELRGVLIPPEGKLRAIFSVQQRPPRPRERPFGFEVMQYEGKQLVGGSEFIFTNEGYKTRSSSRTRPLASSTR